MHRGHVARGWVLLALAAGQPGVAPAQTGAPTGGRVLEVRELAAVFPGLRNTIAVHFEGKPLEQALREVAAKADLALTYSDLVLPKRSTVWLTAERIRADEALERILSDAGLGLIPLSNGRLVVVPSEAAPAVRDTGAVAGRVTDKQTNSPLGGATVSLSPGNRSATTDTDGRYRISDVVAGNFAARVRYIGYTPLVASVTVRADEEATVDFALEKSAQQLEDVVTTGTLVPTEVKALPTPVSVIDEEDIALQRPQNVQDLFRKAVPGAVGWSYGSAPYQTTISVRGASSLSTGSSAMKIFIDGVNVASKGYSQIDPSSIERVEVIRGPQAAAIYGSEAIGGVMQVFTKRGDPGLTRPQVQAEAGVGVVQTPYAGFGGVFRQEYKGSVRGGGPDLGYSVGAGYSRLSDWLPNGEVSRQANPSVYGGVHFARGIVGIDISGRHYVQEGGNNVVNPELLETGYPPYSKPSYQPMQTQNQTVGARLNVAPTAWWRSSINVGFDRYSYDLAQARPRLTTPADTLLLVANQVEAKTSIGFNTSFEAALGTGMSGSLIVGAEHWSLPVSSWYAIDAITTTGAIETGASGVIGASRTVTTNTGYFTQAQIGFRDVLFLTGGLRAERNTDFGDSLGTPLLPRVGLAYVRTVGKATVKARGSWGRAILPPSPGRKGGYVSATSVQLTNPQLGPERQQGWDAGIDATFGALGSLSLTYYDQTATNLVDAVVVTLDPVYTQQFQNVGSVKNTGVEVEARLAVGVLTFQGQFGYSRSRVEALSPTYLGDLRIGEEPLLRPRHTAGASVTAAPFTQTTISAGLAYVGAWTDYDYVAFFRCRGGTGACQPAFRDYQVAFPGFAKLNLSLFHRFTPVLAGFLSIDNLTNNAAIEGTNTQPVRGRSTITGLQFRY